VTAITGRGLGRQDVPNELTEGNAIFVDPYWLYRDRP